jgi:hypothetical protein
MKDMKYKTALLNHKSALIGTGTVVFGPGRSEG